MVGHIAEHDDEAISPVTSEQLPQSRRERFIRKLTGLMVRGVFRRVDVLRMEEDVGRPRLSVSNHFGGASDALLLVYATQRLPRIMARDVIWRVPVARSIMKWVGAIPVHKPEDRGPGSNDIMFGEAYSALGEDAHVLIFPEGITRDEPSIAPLKTGAARIVMGARANGVEGIEITPTGVHYENKGSLRSSVSVLVGRSIDLDTTIKDCVSPGEDEGPENRDGVRALTNTIETDLRRVAPDFADWDEAHALTGGAEILLRTLSDDPRDKVPLAERNSLAGHLGRRPAPTKARVVEAVDRYTTELSTLGLTDAKLLSGITGRQFLLRTLGWLVLTLVLLPFALVGVAINWIPYLLVKAVGFYRAAPAMMATVKPVAAILFFGITWGIAIWGAFGQFGGPAAILAALLLPLYLTSVIVVLEAAELLWTSFTTWRRLRAAHSEEHLLAARREEVLDVLMEAL